MRVNCIDWSRGKSGVQIIGLLLMASVSSDLWADHKNKARINLGSIQATELGKERGLALSGRAMIVRNADGSTSAFAQAVGLAPATAYGAHVHDLPCDLGGGGHYKNDPNVAEALESNEIWVSFTTDDSGTGVGQGTGDFLARPEAQSIVIHDADGGRIGCADLKQNFTGATVHSGKLMHLANSPAGGATNRATVGDAIVSRANGSTFSVLNVQGLAPNTEYPTHVHNLPCSVNTGGSHYKIDPGVAETVADNEIWLIFKTDENGNGSSSAVTDAHTARPEAQSVVVHAPDGTRLACADLKAYEPNSVLTRGKPITTEVGLSRGYRLSGNATMIRESNGRTRVKVYAAGLTERTTYSTHVHDLPCKLGGGGHYKIDPAVSDTLESNEVWPVIRTSKKGRGIGKARVDHLARPEAQSIVIHDPSDGARIGCFDLD